MATPGELREQAQTLRDAARAMRAKASHLTGKVDELRRHYPRSSDGVWVGPSADAYFDQVDEVRGNLAKVRTDVDGYADDCETKATHLEHQADHLEAEQRKKDHPPA